MSFLLSIIRLVKWDIEYHSLHSLNFRNSAVVPGFKYYRHTVKDIGRGGVQGFGMGLCISLFYNGSIFHLFYSFQYFSFVVTHPSVKVGHFFVISCGQLIVAFQTNGNSLVPLYLLFIIHYLSIFVFFLLTVVMYVKYFSINLNNEMNHTLQTYRIIIEMGILIWICWYRMFRLENTIMWELSWEWSHQQRLFLVWDLHYLC